MFIEGMSFIDMVYGGSIFNLLFWIIFGIGSQAIILIIVLGRKSHWSDVCWGILRVQAPVLFIILWGILLNPPHACCFSSVSKGDLIRMLFTELVNISVYGTLYFGIMSVAIFLRFRRPPCLSSWSTASLLAYLLDLHFTTIIILLVLT